MGVQTVQSETPFEEGPDDLEQRVQLPVPAYTYILLACIAAVFLTQIVTSDDPDFFLVDRFSGHFAGFDKPAFLKGEYWRILTGTLVHSGALHFGMNCFALWNLGRIVELLSNRAHLAIVFVLSALGGDILSLIFRPDAASVGASGGIIGFLTYLAVYAFKRRRFTSKQFRRDLVINIGIILAIGLALYDVIDNYGHIGGLLVGAIYALVQVPSDETVDPREASTPTKFIGAAAIGLYVVTAIFTVMILLRAN